MSAPQSKHAIGYCRVSTDQQDCSLEIQRERIADYCRLHGLALDAVLVESDISGKTRLSERPQGRRVASLIAAGARHVVALKLDRLFRNAADALVQCESWQALGVSLHLIDMGGTSVNTSSPMGKMMLTMLAGFAEFERGMIAERTTQALRHRRDNHQAYNHTPYGYDLASAARDARGKLIDTRLVPNPRERSAIALAARMREDGVSYQRIADHFNAAGIDSKQGGVWRSQAVKNILKSVCLSTQVAA
jgi:DNA invertase Pin-like site-specific DNA recombinase